MTGFSITDTAFTGFRVVREHPKAVAFWAVAQLVFTLLTTYALGPALTQIQRLDPDALPDPNKLVAILQPFWPGVTAVFVVAVIANAVLAAAMNRAVLRPDEDRFGYLRLGASELRQLGLMLILMALAYVAMLFGAVVATVLFGGVSAPAFSFLIICALGVWAFVGTRLSLASAMTFETTRIDLAAAWRATQSRFWPLFGAFMLSLAMSLCVMLLTTIVIWAAEALVGGGVEDANKLNQADMISLAALLTPVHLINLILGAISTALVWPIWMTPPAAIYQSLAYGPD